MPKNQAVISPERKKIAIYYPYFMGGGAEAVALWMLEALKDHYDLTLFTFSQIDLQQLNSMYGTNLTNHLIEVKAICPQFLSYLANFLISNNKDFRQFAIHLLIRYLKSVNFNYDLLVSAYNAADLGRRGIQYIHWVKVIEGGKPIYRKISNFSIQQLRENIAIANSHTVADTVHNIYGIEAKVIYPPVVLKSTELPWHMKENSFICSGRLVESKQPHKVIEILQEVRQKGYDINLYFTGGGGGVAEQKYELFLIKMVQDHASWVKLYKNLTYEEYSQVLYKCKYGIHLKKEPFGISIAEMVKAGAIPFVKSQGGQVEIVGAENTDLFFDNEEEAREKIVTVLKDPSKQASLVSALERQKSLFSTERFMQETLNFVDDYCKNIY